MALGTNGVAAVGTSHRKPTHMRNTLYSRSVPKEWEGKAYSQASAPGGTIDSTKLLVELHK